MTATVEFVNYYEILGLAATADDDAIKRAIREQRRTWNKRAAQADAVKRAQAEERVRQISAAERVLLDATQRRQFDREVQNYRPPTPATTGGHGARDWMAEAKQYFENGNAPFANYASREALALDGANHEAWSIRANSSFLMGGFRDAEYEFNEAIRLQPQNPEYRFDLGEAYAAAGQWPLALQQYEQALRLEPRNPTFKTAIANVYLQNDLPAKTVEIMESVVREHPEISVFQYYLALGLHDLTLTNWTEVPGEKFVITSPAQIEMTRKLCGGAIRLNFDDRQLRSSLEDNLRIADAAESKVWMGSDNLKAYAFFLVLGLFLIGVKGLGLIILIPLVVVFVMRHYMPTWKRNAKLAAIVRPGI